ncbi:MAG: 60S acidic ribosomal protein P1 [Geoglossum simile]|nr:MAG: 60S acidic ribosomal protein P1 [Geoglossum simile]
MSNAEIATSYAALILADDGVDITADKLQTLIKAAKIDDVEPIWTSLFAKHTPQALEGKDVKDLLLNVGSGGSAAAAPTTGGAAGGAASTEAAKEEEKEEEKEESDEDMGFGLFD